MFAVNVTIHSDQTSRPLDDTDIDRTAVYYNVNCSTCSAHIAVYDEQQVYHFFNVIHT